MGGERGDGADREAGWTRARRTAGSGRPRRTGGGRPRPPERWAGGGRRARPVGGAGRTLAADPSRGGQLRGEHAPGAHGRRLARRRPGAAPRTSPHSGPGCVPTSPPTTPGRLWSGSCGRRMPPHSMIGPRCSACPLPPSPRSGPLPPRRSASRSVRSAWKGPEGCRGPLRGRWWSTCPRCGRGRCAGSSWPRRGPTWSRSSRWRRPDGARHGPAAFFDLLNGPKRSVALDLASPRGRGPAPAYQRRRRRDRERPPPGPRADGHHGGGGAAPAGRAPVWTSITSHGRGPGQAERVGFGDVAAVAGGLVARDEQGPCFLADAVADPLGGLVAAAAVLEALAADGHWLLSVALAPLAAAVAGPALRVDGAPASPPGPARSSARPRRWDPTRPRCCAGSQVSSLVLRDAEVDGAARRRRGRRGHHHLGRPRVRRGGADVVARLWRRCARPRAARSPSAPALHGRGRRIGRRVGRRGRRS